MNNTQIRYHKTPLQWVVTFFKWALLIAWAATTIVPLVWVLLNSFKSSDEILRSSLSLPTSLDLSNYVTLVNYPDVNIPRAFLNSFIISGSVVLLVVICASMASFALGRLKVRASTIIMAILTACLLVPSFATVIPNFVTISHLSFAKGNWLAAILPQTAGNLCFSTIMMTGFMQSLPQELDEAAIIDGASVPTVFFRISLPLCRSIIATVAIMVFVWSYNDLFTSLVYISERSKQPICVILSMVSNMFGTDYGAMMAAVVVTMLPLILLYIVAQEQVVSGLTAGAVKG
ncbi:MAG: carbohydrate ABC transporter permease [Blautia massiliensis (ex Durand et al. 2017)]|uniref:carbohydrate ABC transporter permease n=1 Tax=uncultured Subdoligranulum sp. TaxID=512298 RepID=UPI002627F290|nr:carbohydrate ABC transporter permease [uncultured Subdoligranulum sp.]